MFRFFLYSCLWISVIFYFFWRIARLSHKATAHLKKVHKIPCADCAFFTHEYRLKCALHPKIALSEEAIDCLDFESNSYSAESYSKRVSLGR